MKSNTILLFLTLLAFSSIACTPQKQESIVVGAEQTTHYLPLLNGKRLGLVVNQTSVINNTHLLDTLRSLNCDITAVFAPEHGFRGDADAGEQVSNGKDIKSGTPVISIYGKNKKPTPEQLQEIDLMIFDIQDVGVRFYTYISTLHYVMEACAEQNIPLLILDRPNPNGDYIAGPILDTAFRSFIGMDPIPVVHGLTVGELAQMINGEKWLNQGVQCELSIIPCKNWNHTTPYSLPIKPSPNLPNDQSIRLYPSLCFFEATEVSIGRGTYFPFQVIGFPDAQLGDFSFVPKSIQGMSKYPKQENITCYGIDLRELTPVPKFTLAYLLEFYKALEEPNTFISRESFFNLLAGTDKLAQQIYAGESETEISQSWQPDLDAFQQIRKNYLLYPDFN